MLRLYRTFSIYIVTGETRCAGRLCTSLGWFEHIDPPRTFLNNIFTNIARDRAFCHMRSGWFDCTEPTLLCSSSGWFKHSEAPRTFLNHSSTEIARCGAFCHMRSGWFDCTEPSLSTLLQGKQGVQGAYALVRGGLSTASFLKPSRTTSSQR